jgi:hypothetical protein
MICDGRTRGPAWWGVQVARGDLLAAHATHHYLARRATADLG